MCLLNSAGLPLKAKAGGLHSFFRPMHATKISRQFQLQDWLSLAAGMAMPSNLSLLLSLLHRNTCSNLEASQAASR
jgi:hypothetical protein